MEKQQWEVDVEEIGKAFSKDMEVSFKAHFKAASEKAPKLVKAGGSDDHLRALNTMIFYMYWTANAQAVELCGDSVEFENRIIDRVRTQFVALRKYNQGKQ